MKKPTRSRQSPKAKSVGRGAASKRAPTKLAKSKAASKPKPKPKAAAKSKAAAKPKKTARVAPKRAKPRIAKPVRKASAAKPKWSKFVEQNGVVLASARGPVPSLAEAIAGEPIVGSWWSHPRAQVIFEALSSIDDADDIRCFKLIDHKVTFVHRRLWAALAVLAKAGVLEADRVASLQQEHMPTGEHRNFTTPFPDWVPDDVAQAAATLSVDDAKTQLGSWL